MNVIAGIDVGGTFTDVLVHDPASGRLTLAKVLSTTHLQADGLVGGLRQVGVPFDRIESVVHGTTVATNAVLERKGARTALVVTEGFRDVLEVRRRDRPTTYGLTGSYRPLVPRSLSFEVVERIDARGEVVTALDDRSVVALVDRLRAAEVESVAVCLMNSYLDPRHEEQLGERLQTLLPDIPVTLSCRVAPEVGEFERASTTVVNAYVRAVMTRYLDVVQDRLEGDGFGREVQVMQSNGGLVPARRAGQQAVRTLLSGPAAGTVAAAAVGRSVDLPDVISCDMGGTSFDVALIPRAQPTATAESSIGYGIPIKVPMIDITTIGAGGGSIAGIDRAGILQVGPESAGSTPGPACYGRGGVRPTVTDANVVLGRIAAAQRLGTHDGLTLDRAAAVAAVREYVAEPLSMDVNAAALAIVRIANEHMANAIRTVSVDKGYDPREFALVGFGGAGPLHIAELARTIGARRVIVPVHPGALSAYGCLIADAKYDYVTSVSRDVDDCTSEFVEAVLAEHAAAGVDTLKADGFGLDRTVVEHLAEMHFSKQIHTIRVPLDGPISGWTAPRLVDAFHTAYRAVYGGRTPASPIRISSLRTVARGRRDPISEVAITLDETAERGSRTVVFDDGPQEVPEIPRSSLRTGERIIGPAVIVQADTTILVPPAATALAHHSGNLIIEVAP
jgi:N-methylhydantoinase A